MQKGKVDPAIARIHADFCRVLASATRIMIIWLLADREKTVSELAEALDLSIANVSQNLRIMRDKGAVVARKDGQKVYYHVANRKFLEGYMMIREGIIEQTKQSLEDVSGHKVR